MRAVPRLCGFWPGICLTTEEENTENLSQGSHNVKFYLHSPPYVPHDSNYFCHRFTVLCACYYISNRHCSSSSSKMTAIANRVFSRHCSNVNIYMAAPKLKTAVRCQYDTCFWSLYSASMKKVCLVCHGLHLWYDMTCTFVCHRL